MLEQLLIAGPSPAEVGGGGGQSRVSAAIYSLGLITLFSAAVDECVPVRV